MTGWQRIIFRHQYGELLHPHDTIARLAAIGRTAGIDSLLLFGWWKSEFLLEGRYRDTEPVRSDNPAVDARAFESGARIMVVVTQDQTPAATARIQVPGYRLVSTDGIGDSTCREQNDALEVVLKKHAVTLAIFQKL